MEQNQVYGVSAVTGVLWTKLTNNITENENYEKRDLQVSCASQYLEPKQAKVKELRSTQLLVSCKRGALGFSVLRF